MEELVDAVVDPGMSVVWYFISSSLVNIIGMLHTKAKIVTNLQSLHILRPFGGYTVVLHDDFTPLPMPVLVQCHRNHD